VIEKAEEKAEEKASYTHAGGSWSLFFHEN
jgi:hypothetical protein